jgi:signal transduction histidine kinase
MLHKIKQLLVPTAADDTARQIQKTLYPILGIAALSVGAVVLMGTVLGWYGVTLHLLMILFVLIIGLLVLNHKGEVRIPSIVLPIATLSAGSYIAAISSGILDEAIWAMPATIVLAGLLLGRRGVVIFSGLVLVATSAIGVGNINGILGSNLPFAVVGAGDTGAPTANLNPLITTETIIVIDILLAGVGALTYVTIDNLANNVERAREAAAQARESARQAHAATQQAHKAAEEIRNYNRELEASQRVTFAATEHTNPDDFLDLIVNLIRDQFNLYHIQIYMIDEEHEHAVLRQSTGYAGSILLQRGHRIPLDATALVTRAITTGDPVLANEVAEEANHRPNPLLPETRSELVVPLKRKGEVIGVLDAQGREPDRFGHGTVTLFQTMADQITILFEKSELMEALTSQTQNLTLFTNQLRTAADIARRLNQIRDPEMLLEEVVELIQIRFDLYHAHIYLLDEDSNELKLRIGSGEVGRTLKARGHTIPLHAERSLVARAARSKVTVRVNDTDTVPDYRPNPFLPETHSELAIPLTIGDRLLGVLDMQHQAVGHFSDVQKDTLNTLSGQIAVALENAEFIREMQQTTDRLRELDRLKSEFLANMSHELRTPLNSILGYAEIMLMGIDGDIDPEIQEDIRGIFNNGQHLLQIINDILDLAKIEAGRLALNKVQVNVGRLLEDVRTHNAGLLTSKPLAVHIEAEPDLPEVFGDPIRLNQVVNNLLSNAIKFTEEGHVKLRAYQDDGHVCVAVEDTGVGIAEEHFDVIFERFRQADGSASRPQEGTGLGLAITRHLVEMHGGSIAVQSQLGRGSVFTVRLPALPQTLGITEPDANTTLTNENGKE